MPRRKHDLRQRDAEMVADETFDAYEARHSLRLALRANAVAREAQTNALQAWGAQTRKRTALIEITGFIKNGGPLTKQIRLSADGKLISDGSACVMSAGYAWQQSIGSLTEFAEFINRLDSNQALALGSFGGELSPVVVVVSERRLRQRKRSSTRYDVISRTSKYFGFRSGSPALVLFDVDTKGMPQEVRDRVEDYGGYLPALISAIPELGTAGHVVRCSTSSGIRRADTGEAIAGSDGFHIFVVIQDGTDAERFLHDFHERCCLAGLGWCRVDAAGRLLNRALVDRMVARPERLVFEGPPVLDPQLTQDEDTRRAVASEGDVLDSTTACPPLSADEQARLVEMRNREAERLAPERAATRRTFIKRQARRLMKRHPELDRAAAEKAVERQIEGVLLPTVVLDFVDAALAGTTVRDIPDNPGRYVGEKLADPIEGRRYDRDCAYINLRSDGSPWIYSFAHGEMIYALKYDAAAIERAINAEEGKEAAELFVKLMMLADDLDPSSRLSQERAR